MTRSVILEARGITQTFDHPHPVTILDGIDFSVHAGETVAIVGASGEGKSTLLHVLGTLEQPSQGEVWIHNRLATRRNAPRLRNQSIGFIFQAFYLMDDYTTIDNVLMPARIARKATHKGSKGRKQAEALLKEVGLGHRIDYPTKLLSGGERQRVAIARALCNNPPIILADEPSGNLDQANSSAIHALLFDLVRDQKRALITVTHDQKLASLCDRVCTLQTGKLVAQ